MPPQILLIGHDPIILHSRRLLLQQLGMEARELCSLKSLSEAASGDIAEAVMCHSLSSVERQQAIELVRQASGRAIILQLRSPSGDTGGTRDGERSRRPGADAGSRERTFSPLAEP